MSEVGLLLIVGYLCLYMYLAFNAMMMYSEWKEKSPEPKNWVSITFNLLSKISNPSEYVKARVYIFGALSMIVGLMIF